MSMIAFKNKIKAQPIYPMIRTVKLKILNYFSKEGEIERRFFQFLTRFDKELQAALRAKIAKQMWTDANAYSKNLVKELERKGYAILNFADLKIESEQTLQFLEDIVEKFRKDEFNEGALQQLDSGDYGGKPISYHLYKKRKGDEAYDPLISLILHPELIRIASMYVGYLPAIGFTSLLFTPVHKGIAFGSQLWHKDLHHRRCLKLFFSPLTLDENQGPFEFFPPHLSTLKYYQHSPQSMTDAQLLEAGLDPKTAIRFLGGPGKVLMVDTTRCLHRGGKAESKPRYIATTMYASPQHSFSAKQFRTTEHYENPFRVYAQENQDLLKGYAKP